MEEEQNSPPTWLFSFSKSIATVPPNPYHCPSLKLLEVKNFQGGMGVEVGAGGAPKRNKLADGCLPLTASGLNSGRGGGGGGCTDW